MAAVRPRVGVFGECSGPAPPAAGQVAASQRAIGHIRGLLRNAALQLMLDGLSLPRRRVCRRGRGRSFAFSKPALFVCA